MGISFPSALLLLTGLFTVLFTTLLILTHNKGDREPPLSHGTANAMLTAADVLALVTLFLNLATPIRAGYPMIYEVAITAIAALTIIPMIASKPTDSMISKALSSVIMLNIILLNDQLPSTGISWGEGIEMYRDMYMAGHWSFSFAYNPAYNPFPAQVAQVVMMAKVLNLPWYSSLVWGIWYAVFTIVYDMVIYMLTLRLTQNKAASVLAAFFVGVTPETALTLNPHLWLSNLFVLISTVTLINVIEGFEPAQNAVISALSYILAVLSLTTALLMLLVPISFIVAWYVLRALRLYKPIHQGATSARKGLILFLFAVYTVVTLLVFLYTQGYFTYVYPMLDSLNQAIWQILIRLFVRSITKVKGVQYHFLYSGANPVLAYAWSLAFSIAASYLLYVVFRKRRENVWLMTLLVVGLVVPGIAAVQRIFTATYPITVNAYTAIPLTFPIVGLALTRLKDKSKAILMLLILLLVAIVPIASYDPSISPIEYAKIHHYNVPPLTRSEYECTLLLNNLLPSNTGPLYVYSPIMGTLPWYTPSLGGVGAYPTNVIAQALPMIRFIYNESSVNVYVVVYNGTLSKAYYVTLGPGIPPTIVYNPLNNPNIIFNSNYATLLEPS
ncbi:hypothetical protein [Vulcanisaeta distributa]|uniref:Glycosyltransferase RgtA/B/C/D-like domain-containing protein n=1 Tax=Vulcanisaeta distributa (strain DSM 14429 / JCM 11212 / NBRC 100878 / IC-017) TaxID=572478 RepID=E1QUE5_VULDI|nr:hypothetical protein [Vulcanisaeta distributa]ADN49871.1 hypothetical protein Vdis_0471 [Vulcanisaeta distributa DSM 14429]